MLRPGRPKLTRGRRTGGCLVAVLALSSCASPLADYSGYVAPRPYAVECGAAWQYAATALKANAFVVSAVRRDQPGDGVVVGERDGDTMRVAVSCEGDGVHVTPSGMTPFARNGMIIAFERVMETARSVQPPKGIEVSAELIAGVESALYFARGLDASAVAARFRIANGGTRPMSLVTDKIRLRTRSGTAGAALSNADIQHRLPGAAAEILPRLLRSAVLETGDRAEGFLIFPSDRYDSALVPLVDVETQEIEEFETTFPASGQ
jgi:hypothetical protein